VVKGGGGEGPKGDRKFRMIGSRTGPGGREEIAEIADAGLIEARNTSGATVHRQGSRYSGLHTPSYTTSSSARRYPVQRPKRYPVRRSNHSSLR